MATETPRDNWFEEGDIDAMYEPDISSGDIDRYNDPDTYIKGGSKEIEDDYFNLIDDDETLEDDESDDRQEYDEEYVITRRPG